MNGALFITCETSLVFVGKLKLDLYDLMVTIGWGGSVIIATPNIGFLDLTKELTKKEFNTIANAENLDLSVLFESRKDGQDVVLDRWELGWDDGNSQFVHIFPKEYFTDSDSWKHFFESVAFRLELQVK